MALLYDTNSLLFLVRDKTGFNQTVFNPAGSAEFLSVVTIAEIHSIAYRNGWGKDKLDSLNAILSKLTVLDINDEGLIYYYVQIDAFHSFRLITTDKDFDHLDQVFIRRSYFDPNLLFRK